MSETTLYAVFAGVVVASLGLWWFRLILKNLRNLPRQTRIGVYALVWLAYFILTLIVINNTSGGAG